MRAGRSGAPCAGVDRPAGPRPRPLGYLWAVVSPRPPALPGVAAAVQVERSQRFYTYR